MGSLPVRATSKDSTPRRASQLQGQATHRYGTLDALRGVAAFAVLLLHARGFFWPELGRSAYLAVDFFFMLSGFVVAHAYDDKLARGMSRADFLQRRIVRLYPLHLAGLLLGAAAAAAMLMVAGDDRLTPLEIGLSLLAGSLFLPSLFTDAARVLFPLNAPAYSLFFEVLINVAYGLVHRWLSQPVLIAAILMAAAALCVQAAVAGTIDSGVTWGNIHGGFARVGFSFSLGVLLFRWRALIPPALGRPGPWPLMAVLFALFMVPVEPSWRVAYELGFLFAIGPVLLAAGAQVTTPASASRGFALLGAMSFPLYALHHPLIGPARVLGESWGIPEPLMGVVYVAGSVVLAWLVVPWDAAVRRWWLGRVGQRTEPGPTSAP